MANSSANSNPAATLAEAGRSGDIRSRLLFLLGALVVYRIGTFIPVPGINPDAVARYLQRPVEHASSASSTSSPAARCSACRSSRWA